MLVKQYARLEEMLKEVYLFDVDVVCKMIDPSNKLARYMREMIEVEKKLSQDTENVSYIQKMGNLRYEIKKFLDTKIK